MTSNEESCLMNNLVIGSYDLTVTDEYIDKVKNMDFGWIDTGVSYNNLGLVKKFLVNGRKLISKFSPFMVDYEEELIKYWYNQLDNHPIDIMMIHNARTRYVESVNKLKSLRDEGILNEIGVSNFSINDIKRYYRLTGEYPQWNEFEINPDYTDLEQIKFCEDHGIKIIAYAIFGSLYRAKRMIRDYSLNYLISYAKHFSDLVIVKSDNLLHMIDNMKAYNHDVKIRVPEVSTNNKSMVPEVYEYPKFNAYNDFHGARIPVYDGKYSYYDDLGFFDRLAFEGYKEYTNYLSKEFLLSKKEGYLVNTKFDKFEFFTEWKEYFLYLLNLNRPEAHPHMEGEIIVDDDYVYNVYLVDNDGRKSKVLKRENKLVILKVRRKDNIKYKLG